MSVLFETHLNKRRFCKAKFIADRATNYIKPDANSQNGKYKFKLLKRFSWAFKTARVNKECKAFT